MSTLWSFYIIIYHTSNLKCHSIISKYARIILPLHSSHVRLRLLLLYNRRAVKTIPTNEIQILREMKISSGIKIYARPRRELKNII
ncbi:hypothetical protein QTP88_006000 [Uroleucon formosanum]